MQACTHLASAPDQPAPGDLVCEDCVANGGTWVHLRQCQECGHMGCCDSSPNRHATAHFDSSEHPAMRSAQPGEDWRWCFVDEVVG